MEDILLSGGSFAISIAIYAVIALALQTIAKREGHKNSWMAWIPIANIALILQLGGYHWALIFLGLIPVLGWIALLVFEIKALYKIFETEGYPGILAIVSAFISPLLIIMLAIIAWKKK